MILQNIQIADNDKLDEFKVKYIDIISRVQSLYEKVTNLDFAPIPQDLELQTPYEGNVIIPIPKIISNRYIFAAVVNSLSDHEDIMMFKKTDDNEVEIVGCEDFSNRICIPAVITDHSEKTYNVTGIGSWAFSGHKMLQNLIIPNSVREIGDFAFTSCLRLKSATIPNSVTEIGVMAFSYCNKLNSIEIPDSVMEIGMEAFLGCTRLRSLTISNSVSEIKKGTFEGCEKLPYVKIPDAVKTIGDYAFRGCKLLEIIKIPNSVIKIGDGAFRNCKKLTSITIPNSVRTIGNHSFESCVLLTEIEIPNSVTAIGDYAFEDCELLSKINIPNTVVKIGNGTFRNCKKLKSIDIPDSVTTIGDYAFGDCELLGKIKIPNSVIKIGDGTFRNCKKLTSIVIPDSVTKICDFTFDGCEHLTTVLFPNFLTEIGDNAFRNCWYLSRLTIPISVITIGVGAFRQCKKANYIRLNNAVTKIGVGAFYKCPVGKPRDLSQSDWDALCSCPILDSAKDVKNIYALAKRSFIQTIFLRNKQHNLGSHVAAKCRYPEFVNNLLKRTEPNYKPLFDGKLNPNLPVDAEHQLAELNNYYFQRDSYCTDLASSSQGNCEYISIRELFAFLDKNRLLLNLISGYDDMFKYHFEIYFEEESTCATINDERLNRLIAIPNGQIGCHAFYNIVENVIRNTAKYASNPNSDKNVAICFRFRTECSDKSSKHPLDNNLFFVEIYSNIEQPKIDQLTTKLNGYINMPIIDRNTLLPVSVAKGMVEMKASATYLQGQDIVNLQDDAYITIHNNQPKKYQEHLSAFDRNGNSKQLNAFALPIYPASSKTTGSSYSNCNTPIYAHQNSTTENQSYHYLSENDICHNKGLLGYRFFMLKPKNVLLVGDAGEKNTTVPSEYGIDLWNRQQLEEHLKNNNNVHYDIMICSEEDILSKYKSRLPKRIIKMSAAEFIERFMEDCPDYKSKNPKTLSSLIEAFAWSMYPKWLKAPDYEIFSTGSCPCFSDHLPRLTKEKFEAKEYIEALSSAAQQKLPNFLRLSDNKGLSHYTAQALSDPLTQYRILESINTKVLLLDDVIQSESQNPPASLREPKIALKLHLQKCRIDIPDINLVGITPEDAIKVIERVKEEGKNYDFIFFHYGLLERMFEQMDDRQLIRLRTLYPRINSDSHDRKKIMVDYLKTLAEEHDVVIKSGRGIPETLPSCIRFVPQVNAEQALMDLKSKYLFSNQLYAARSESSQQWIS